MNSKKLVFFLFCALAFATGASAARQDETLLRGVAVDGAGAPAGFATAYLTGADGAVVCGTAADADGRFELRAAYGEYHSPGYTQNIMITNHFLDLSAAVQKTLLKDGSLVLRLEGSDLAGLGHNNVFTDLGSYRVTQSIITDSRRVVFSVRYCFNSAESKYKGTGAGKDARSRMN